MASRGHVKGTKSKKRGFFGGRCCNQGLDE